MIVRFCNIFIFLIFFCVFCYFSLQYYLPFNTFNIASSFLSNFRPKSKVCVIPKYDPRDTKLDALFKPVSLPLVCLSGYPTLSNLTEDGILKFHPEIVNRRDSLNCTLTCVYRGKDDMDVAYGPSKLIDFSNSNGTKVDCEFPQVNCTENDSEIYSQIHAQIVVDEVKLKQLDSILPPNQRQKYHHVILLIWDSVSLLNFERFCPKTTNLLKRLYHSVSYKGMTRSGTNSAQNAMALFMGKYHINYGREDIFKRYWDDWNIIWKNYSQNGYLTLDDQDGLTNIFLWRKRGFLELPTDHRLRVFWLASRILIKGYWEDFGNPCRGNKAKHLMQFDYLHDFLNKYEQIRPKFVMFWNTAAAHDKSETLAYIDDDFATFLEKHHDLLKESFLFVMADHGNRDTEKMKTKIGRTGSHMPLLMVSLPESIRKKHPKMVSNMEHNSELLVSHFDSFVTLNDILSSQKNGWGDLSKQLDWSHLKLEVTNAQSYLRPLPSDRTCSQIGIPSESCICQSHNFVPASSLTDGQAVNVSLTVVQNINSIVSDRKQCAKMSVERILKFEKLLSDLNQEATFRISLQVNPSHGTFEALVSYDDSKSEYFVNGAVLRTNKYANQSYCIAKSYPSIKPFCYCV